MSLVVVRYKTKDEDHANENARLVADVFAELNADDPGGIRYATFRLADGSFIHVGDIEGEVNPLADSPAFKAFQACVADRCEEGQTPELQGATIVGNYRAF